LLYMWLEEELAAGRSCVVECNFKAEHDTPIFLELMERHLFTPFQIVCYTEGETLLARWKARWESGGRHPGHVEHTAVEEFTTLLLAAECPPLDIGGEVYVLDTTDFAQVDYPSLLRRVQKAIGDP
jgi:hypothetical protein